MLRTIGQAFSIQAVTVCSGHSGSAPRAGLTGMYADQLGRSNRRSSPLGSRTTNWSAARKRFSKGAKLEDLVLCVPEEAPCKRLLSFPLIKLNFLLIAQGRYEVESLA